MDVSQTPEVVLGNIVKDRISNFEGVLISRTTWLYGCVRLTVKPNKLSDDGKTIAAETFDKDQVLYVAEGENPTPWRDEPEIRGKRIKDKVTGLDGICTAYNQNLYGEDEVILSPQKIKDGVPVESLAFVVGQIEIIEPALEATPVGTRPPGGPHGEKSIRAGVHVR